MQEPKRIVFSSIIAACMASVLVACGSKEIVLVPEAVLVDISPDLLDCKRDVPIPRSNTLKDGQVADLIVGLNNNIRRCEADDKTIISLQEKQKFELEQINAKALEDAKKR